MAKQYATYSFLRHAPNVLLRRYLATKGLGNEINWDSLKEAKIDPIVEVIDAAPAEVRAQLERDFQDIHEMATEAGIKTLIDEGRDTHHGVELAEILGNMESYCSGAFWSFLEHPGIFNIAKQFNYADNLPQRSWRKRKGLPSTEPATDLESRERLASAISAYYYSKEGRGKACTVEHYKRGDKLYWFAYPQDYARVSIEYNLEGEFEPRPQRPAFEVIFVFCPDESTLDLFVRGISDIVNNLQEIWGRAVLGMDLGFPDKKDVVYKLNPLKDRKFRFFWDPSEGIEDVRVKKLRLSVLGQKGNKRMILEADASEIHDGVYDLLDDILVSKKITKELLNVTQVGLQIVFHSNDKRGRQQTLNFDVSYPDSCSLKYEPKHDIARKYLKLWGIDVSGNSK